MSDLLEQLQAKVRESREKQEAAKKAEALTNLKKELGEDVVIEDDDFETAKQRTLENAKAKVEELDKQYEEALKKYEDDPEVKALEERIKASKKAIRDQFKPELTKYKKVIAHITGVPRKKRKSKEESSENGEEAKE